MKRTLLFLLMLMASATVFSREFSQREINDIQRSFSNFMSSKGAKGGGLIISNGKNAFEAAYGVRDGKGSPFLITTPSRIASASKPITAAAVLLLIQEGKLGFNDTVIAILNKDRKQPIIPKQKSIEAITVGQLLTHTGGFSSDAFIFNQVNLGKTYGKKLPMSPTSLVEIGLTTQTINGNPGSRFQYSNFGYLILGRIIEKVSGKSYEEYVRTTILAPAGIGKEEAFIASSRVTSLRENETRYWDLMNRMGISLYSEDMGSRVPFQYGAYAPESMDAFGGWALSTLALVKFQLALPRLLKAEMQDLITFNSGAYHNGLGFSMSPRFFSFHHGGSLEGCNAAIMSQGNGVVIAMTCNTGGPPDDNGWSFEYINRILIPLLNRMEN